MEITKSEIPSGQIARELRVIALRLARETVPGGTPAAVVKAAKTYYKFLKEE